METMDLLGWVVPAWASVHVHQVTKLFVMVAWSSHCWYSGVGSLSWVVAYGLFAW